MSKIDPNFPNDIFTFLHEPIRKEDSKNGNLVERFLQGPQIVWEQLIDTKINEILNLWSPADTPSVALPFLKPIVGLTSELDDLTKDLNDNDLRRIISLFVQLTGQKGTEVGYTNIIRIFTGNESRLFNWFDFRFIVGGTGFGEDQLGHDAWAISQPGIDASTPLQQTVGLWTFENNLEDGSVYKNTAEVSGNSSFPQPGFVSGSNYSLWLKGGFLRIKNSNKYDFSASFTIELFVSTTINKDSLLFQKTQAGKEITIWYLPSFNVISWTLSDGTVTITNNFIPGDDIDDGVVRHIALVVDKTKNFARLWYNGNGSTKEDISTLGDLTNAGDIMTTDISFSIANRFEGFIDNLRMVTNAVYDVDGSTIIVPTITFVKYREEQLDEFFSDIRVVDNGSLNRTLVKKLVNLMRPVGERVNIIYVKYYTDFSMGKGDFNSSGAVPSSIVDNNLIMPPLSQENSDIINQSTFLNIVLQVKFSVISGDVINIIFGGITPGLSYMVEISMVDSTFKLIKVLSAVPIPISPAIVTDLVLGVDYIITISTFVEPITNKFRMKVYHDKNLLIDVTTSQPSNGGFGLETDVATTAKISEIELFTTPLDVDVLIPNIKL